MTKPRFRSVFLHRTWQIPPENLREIARFPVGLLLRPGGWILIGCRPSEVPVGLELLKGWGLEFGTLAFRKHYPYKSGNKAWRTPHNYILREDLQEVQIIGFKPPYNDKGLRRWAVKGRQYMTNFPGREEFRVYWKQTTLWGFPRLEIWGRPYTGQYDPKRWTRIGPYLDGMPITQSLWLEHAKRFTKPLDTV